MDDLLPFQTAVVDAEFDDLAANRIFCIVVRDVHQPNLVKKFVNYQEAKDAGVPIAADWLPLKDYIEFSKCIGTYVAHNWITFDAPCIEKFLKVKPPLTQVYDTLVVSRLLQPYRESGHSLDAWGAKLGYLKTSIDDFSKFTATIVDDRCAGDTEINVKLYHELQKEVAKFGFSNFSIRLEHSFQEIIHGQEKHGFYLDRQKAHKLLTDTQTRLNEIEAEMVNIFGPQPVLIKTVVPKRKKDGDWSTVGLKKVIDYFKAIGIEHWWKEIPKSGPIALFELEDFNLGSPPQVKERLMEIGWKPLNLTPKGAPKIDEESLLPFADKFPQVRILSEYLTVRARNGLASQWLELCDKDGYVHGRCFTLGAITGRCTHQNPNMANVPKADPSVLYGEACRGCWTIEDPSLYAIVGCDAASLELRMLCHYMDDAEYTKEVVGGDIHTKNQKAAGLPTRNDAKTFIYALLYGAGDGKIGKIIGKGVKEGRKLKENFFEAIPKLRKLFLDIGQQAKYHGFVTGLDGRKIWTRSEHAALNTLLQGGGAIVCKLWTVYIHKFANEQGLRFQQLVSVHDEYQFQVHKDDVEAFGAVTKAAMKEVEKVLKMKCPLDSTWKKGYNWSETH